MLSRFADVSVTGATGEILTLSEANGEGTHD